MMKNLKDITAMIDLQIRRTIDTPIDAGSEYGKALGFTNRFNGYLWDAGDGSIVISFIQSIKPGRGDFSSLVKGLIRKGFVVKVPTPSGKMESILQHLGFEHTIEHDQIMGDVDVWIIV